jgi:hypothetical protein
MTLGAAPDRQGGGSACGRLVSAERNYVRGQADGSAFVARTL